ncbi:hypothetical protein ACEPAI_2242 [Sanghuangporus weigelae]
MDDLTEFLKQQNALAEIPEGDIEEYAARMRLRAKRRKLWRSDDEYLTSPSQREREAYELSDYFQSLSSQSDILSSVQDSTGPNRKEEDVSVDPPKNISCPANTIPLAEHSDSRQQDSDRPNNWDDIGGPVSPGNGGDFYLLQKKKMPSLEDCLPVVADRDSNDDAHVLSDVYRNRPSRSPDNQMTKVSNNGMTECRESILRKRKLYESDEPTVADNSNITSPPNSPGPSSPSLRVSRILRPRPTVESARKGKGAEKAERDREAAVRKKEEEMEKRMTPREYAVHIQEKFRDYLAKAPTDKLPLRDKAIFYVGGDYYTASQSTRRKMDHLRRKGAIVIPSYDPETVTHIVTEASAAVTLKALGLKSLDEIPMYIPTLTWNWVTERRQSSPEFWFAAFPSRIDASSEKTPEYLKMHRLGKVASAPRPMEPSDEDYSRIEEFTAQEHAIAYKSAIPKPGDREGSKSSEMASDDDPLAEFYDQARKEQQELKELSFFSDRSSGDEKPSSAEVPKSRWTCDQGPVSRAKCVNQGIVDKLTALEEINKTKISGDPREQRWRVFSYGKSIRAIRAHSKRIRNYEDAISIRGVGAKTAKKIVEIIETGDLERIRFDNTEDVHAIKSFTNIYGVGLETARKWYIMGCKTLEDIRNRKGDIKLSEVQEIGLKYYDDINTRIPRKEVEEIFNLIKSIALGIDPKLSFQLMGSYRRGAETCGDIDILMTRPTDDGKTHRGVLRLLLKELHLQGILTEDLAIPEDFNDLQQTYRGLCRRDEGSPRRRIDILVVPYHERGGALIYYTGDDIFNRAIRLKAKSTGYSLSQHGLARRAMRDNSGKRMVPVDLIASETEEEIFRILGVPWQEPHERIRALPTSLQL